MKQIVLRAYQMARSGKCATIGHIQNSLCQEGYNPLSISENLTERSLVVELTKLCKEPRHGYTVLVNRKMTG